MNESRSGLRVVESGWATTIQDRGRTGWAHLGVPAAGAVDRETADRMNRLVGNPPDAAVLETAGGLVVEARGAAVVARSTDDSRITLAPGERVHVEVPEGQVWAYLAVRGGVDVEPVLGSRSQDTLCELGPPTVTDGDILATGTGPLDELITDLAPVRHADRRVRVWDGPHVDVFAHGTGSLTTRQWQMTDASRVGRRLAGEAIAEVRHEAHPMRSIGLVAGAIQVPPSGTPIVMLANHPTTGGYPVIAVVEPDDLATIAQSAPGSPVRFISAERE